MTTQRKTTLARLYLRVSTDEQAQSGTSLASQREILSSSVEAKGWEAAEVYVDDGVSGAKSERPALTRLLRDVRPGEVVAVYSIDRFARKLSLLLNLIDRLDEIKVSFFSVREDWDTSTPMGKFAVQMVGAAAELERGIITERTRLGREQRARQGKWPSGTPPFGLKMGDDGMLEQVPEKAKTVKLVFDLFLSERIGLIKLRNRLHELGVPAPSGKAWWKESGLHRVLTNRAYAGLHANGAVAPAIVSERDFERAQTKLKANNRFRPRATGRVWPLQGRIRCAECGTRWRVNVNNGTRSYFCPGREANSRHFERTGKRCGVPRANAETLERLMWDTIRRRLSDPREFLEALDDSIRGLEVRLTDLETGIGPAQRELAETEAALARLATEFVHGALSPQQTEKLRLELEERRRAASDRIDALGPELKAELEETRRQLQGANDWRETVVARIRKGIGLDRFAFDPELAESDEHDGYRKSGDHPLAAVDDRALPVALTRALDRLQADVIAHRGRFELRGLVAIDATNGEGAEAAISDPSSSTSSRRSG